MHLSICVYNSVYFSINDYGQTHCSPQTATISFQLHQWIVQTSSLSEGLLNQPSVSAPSCSVSSVALDDSKSSLQSNPFSNIRLLLDGPMPMRLVLHPELSVKEIDASSKYPYLFHFVDIRKRFSSLYDHAPGGLAGMCQCE